MRRNLAATLALAFTLLASSAGAALQWYEHYQRGLTLAGAQRWQEAAEEFAAAIQVERAPRRRIRTYGPNFLFDYDPHYHLARCLTELGRYREAAGHLAIATRAGVTPRGETQALRDRIEAAVLSTPVPDQAASRTAEVSIDSDPPGARVLVGGEQRGTTPLGPLRVVPGRYHVRLEAPGYLPEEATVDVAPGPSSHHFSLRPAPLAATPVPVASQPTATPTPPTVAPTPTAAALPPVSAATATPSATSPPATATPAQPPATPLPTSTPLIAGLEVPASRGGGLLTLAVVVVVAVFLVLVAVHLLRRPRFARPAPTAATRVLEEETILAGTPTLLKNYRVLGTLGRGGMATTYQARREGDGALVALKVPHEFCLTDESFVARFLREGKLGEQLHHPRIVRIFEAGEDQGRPFLAMELLEGRTLKQELRAVGRFGLRQSLEVARDIAEALDYAHAKGVVHRDLKPENIMLLQDGSLKVMDFGIARLTGQEGLTSASLFIGTPLYAAPEMVEPTSVDHRVDLYALGIILYEMLQGTVPFTADSPYRVLEMHMRSPLPAREALVHPVPEAVWAIVERLCAKQREDRHPHAEALLVELNTLLHNFTELGLDDDR